MKKTILPLALAVVLAIVAAVMLFTGSVQGELLQGGVMVRINARGTYDADSAASAMAAAGFRNGVLLESNRTAIEVQADSMSETALADAAAKLLAAVQEGSPNAELVYAEAYTAPGGTGLKGLLWASIGFVVLAFLYGWARYGWRRSMGAAALAVIAAVLTGSVGIVCSGLLGGVTYAFCGMVAGVLLVTYLYILVLYARLKDTPDYAPTKADLAVPALVVIACMLAQAFGGAAVAKALTTAVIGSAVAAWLSWSAAPALWQGPAKKTAK